MNKTITKIESVRNEVVRYLETKPRLLRSAILSNEVLLNRYATKISKVKGEYLVPQVVMGHLVQIFESKKFTPFGEISFLAKELKNYHQKIDFVLDPAEILGTIFEDTYDESKGIQQKSISKLAIDLLLERIIDDVNILSITGKYEASQKGSATPTFGTSMDGLNEVLKKNVANTDNPVFSIPGDAVTASNILDVVTNYEKQIPSLAKHKVKRIFMSDADLENYQLAYEDRFGQNKFQDNATRTRLGKRGIVGIPNLTPGTIFSTVEGNLLQLIDEISNPATISDVQVQDRILKVFGEFRLGYDFGVNQLLYVHNVDGSKQRGLNDAEQNKLLYASETNLIV